MNEPLGAQLRQVIPKRRECVIGGRTAEGFRGVGMNLGGGEAVLRSDVRKADQGMHEGKLTEMIEFQSGDTLAVGKNGWFDELLKFATIDERLEDILLHIVVPVDDRR